MTLDSGSIRLVRILRWFSRYMLIFLRLTYACAHIQVCYAVLVVKITLRLLITAANRLSYF